MELKLLGQAWGLHMFFRSLEGSYTGCWTSGLLEPEYNTSLIGEFTNGSL